MIDPQDNRLKDGLVSDDLPVDFSVEGDAFEGFEVEGDAFDGFEIDGRSRASRSSRSQP
jgi:hypothetical protein